MMTLQEKNEVLVDALASIDKIAVRFFRDTIGASKEEKYDCGKTAFDDIAKVVASVVRRDLFGEEQAKKDAGLSFEDAPNLNEVLLNPPFGKETEEKMSRPEAVRILMQLQKVDARAGNVNITRAYEMAIAYIVKRHRDNCRNKAKRRAAARAAAAKEEK